MNHPTGVRPSIAFAGPIDVYQERQGVLAVVIEYTRLARFLSQLEVGRTGTAFIVDDGGELVAAPDKEADELHPARGDITLLPLARMALEKAGEAGRKEAWRSRLMSGGAAYEVALTPLPFPGWSLATVIPEAEFLGPVEMTLRRLILGLAVGAVLAALASAMLARSVIAARRCRASPASFAMSRRLRWSRFAGIRRASRRSRACRAPSPRWPPASPRSASSFRPIWSARCCARASRRGPAAASRS
ncbi:hypothetical protein ABIF63_008449 [Bradyrhizobium japonicum]|uniref:Cache domain-containing protein n=1 Tax=Bradyrhizobium japonicum TaxID=375 RepID=A0ABV2S588_BRAJP